MAELQFRANAKINLFLEVLDRRPDGYHNIETVFQSIDLYDTIILRESASGIVEVECDNPYVPVDSSNLVYKAAELLLKESGTDHGIHIKILKRIPVGAGLAGGSTDAAATLIGLNELWGLGYSADALIHLGGKLGADVPFCITGGTALGQGRGDQLTRLMSLPEIPLVIANPGFEVSTAWAYENLRNLGLTRVRKSANILIEKMQRRTLEKRDQIPSAGGDSKAWSDISEIAREFFNVFESVVMKEYPLVLEIKEELIRAGALGALMTGSGPTVFALARDLSEATHIREKASKTVHFCIVSKTSSVSIARM